MSKNWFHLTCGIFSQEHLPHFYYRTVTTLRQMPHVGKFKTKRLSTYQIVFMHGECLARSKFCSPSNVAPDFSGSTFLIHLSFVH